MRSSTEPTRSRAALDTPAATRWRSLAGASLLLLACGGAVAIHHAVGAEWMDDTTSLAVTAATSLLLGAAALVAMRLTLRHAGWRRRLAAGLLPLGLVAICGGFVAVSLPDASVEMEALVEAGGPQEPQATIELGPRGDDVRLSGELREGTAQRLAVLLAANPRVTRIHLTSEGGLVDEGQALGDIIAGHGLTTFVPDYCISACTLAFVRGSARLVLEDSRIGFHSPFETGLFGAIYQGDSSEQRAEYLAAGVARDFVDKALKVKPDDIWYPSPDRLIAAHVATAMVARDQMPDSNLDGMATLGGARAAILRSFPVLGAFRARSPDALDALAGWYLDAYRRARPESENNEHLRTIVESAVLVALTRADDATLVEAGRILARGMVAAADDPEACVRIGTRADLLEAETQLVRTDPSATGRIERIVATAAAGYRMLHGAGGGRAVATAADPDEAQCEAARTALEAILRRTTSEAATALRQIADADALRSLADVRTIAASRP